MKNEIYILRIVTITLILLIFLANNAFCFDLDITVDDDIRKNYNSSKLVKDTQTEDLETLPELPEKLKKDMTSPIYTNNTNSYSAQIPIIKGNVKIQKGTSFNVVNIGSISDWQSKGTTVKFKTTTALNKKKYVIPAYTIFTGEIIESHQPQISCNGGLIVIRIKSMQYKNQTIPLNAYITRANDKLIFFNNIKGERTYLKTVWKKGAWGRSLFNRMLSLTVNLGSETSTFILSPFPFAYGTICLGANTLISPITAFFSKGKHISINSGSNFKIKLLEDAYID